jgi:hypothetical protein
VLPFTATAGIDGSYSAAVPGGFDWLPGDRARVEFSAEGTRFYAWGAMPAVRVDLYASLFSGVLDPLQAYTLTVTPPGTATVTLNGTATADGTIVGVTWPAETVPGSAIGLDTPDWHTDGSLAALTVNIEPATARLTGTAPAHSRLLVTAFEDLGVAAAQWATATAAGHYSVTFPSLAPLSGAAHGTVTHYGPGGLHTRLAWSPPHWRITLGEPCVSGGLGAAAPATLALRRGAEVLDAESVWVGPNGEFSACFARPVAVGDVLAASQLDHTRVFTVPVLTAGHDWSRRALEGQAPPGSRVTVEFVVGGVYQTVPVARTTVADAAGIFGVDTSDLGLVSGRLHTVTAVDAHGNSVELIFELWRTTLYFPAVHN